MTVRKKTTTLKDDLLSRLIRSNNSDKNIKKADLPNRLFLLPLTERPFFPSQTQPLITPEAWWLTAAQAINKTPLKMGGLIRTVAKSPSELKAQTFALTGTLARVHHPVRANKKLQFIAEGIRRFTITEFVDGPNPFEVKVEYPDEADIDDNKAIYKAYAQNITRTLKSMMQYNPLYNEELKYFLNRFTADEPSPLCDFAASLISNNTQELQSILDTLDLELRMEKVLVLAQKEFEMVKLQAEIRQDVEAKLSEHQRKFFLKEQLKIIQKELGVTKDDKTADVEMFRERIDDLELSSAAEERVEAELNKLAVLEPSSAEYGLTRNYLDTITSLPWGKLTTDKLSIPRARTRLNAMHEGLDEVKKRLLEFIAVGKLKGELSGTIILLVGPPGVGKTSIGRSIADALGRAFYRFSVGGMRDEAEIKGHRKTYVGAMTGKLLQAIKEAGSCNPVIMLDEIDKLGKSHQGDPAAALLEVLDPEQNHTFLDHYLDVRFDLSKVLFVCTANQLDTIPQPLLDRMEVIRLSGYLTEEKISIAKSHLWPKLLNKHGIKKSKLTVSKSVLKTLVEGYARESGVRNLEKLLAQLCRKAAMQFAQHADHMPIRLTKEHLNEYLGPARFENTGAQRGVGIITGLAWTAMGGATLNIESAIIPNRNNGLTLTGQLGQVMQESAQIAYSFMLSRLGEYCDRPEVFNKVCVHLHVPEGATPKDGPSAGITMASSLLSLANNQPLRKGIAMTGELTLTGEVLAVGGIREKLVAAKRVNIKEVILPKAVKASYDALPTYVKKGITVHFVGHFDEVAALLF